jgi:hypothetical protein
MTSRYEYCELLRWWILDHCWLLLKKRGLLIWKSQAGSKQPFGAAYRKAQQAFFSMDTGRLNKTESGAPHLPTDRKSSVLNKVRIYLRMGWVDAIFPVFQKPWASSTWSSRWSRFASMPCVLNYWREKISYSNILDDQRAHFAPGFSCRFSGFPISSRKTIISKT